MMSPRKRLNSLVEDFKVAATGALALSVHTPARGAKSTTIPASSPVHGELKEFKICALY